MSPLPPGIRADGDTVTPWFKRAGTIAAAIVAIVAAFSIGTAVIVKGAESVLFWKTLPEAMTAITKDVKIIKRVVCRAHPPCEAVE